MPNSGKAPATPRDRLVDTARKLFPEEGAPHVGISKLTDVAQLVCMTPYNNFRLQNDLVLAVFEQEAELRRASISSVQSTLEGPFEKVLALFVVALELAGLKGFRGCAFINLVVEAAAPNSATHALAKKHKEWILDNLLEHLTPEVFADPDMLARQILVLLDGGIVGACVQQPDDPIRAARDAARVLMRSAAR
ncbi:hypothetical protein [uncultured Roseobacter sp.]|uniref:TetR/AcrR family transcriptional regulator n=1 Tax=uncultured Roseobacter sp. TaxID=114847 RepID=UPI00261DE03B|nr:hypothetical protein [uncultured Roseobacter sp.]